jgi:hypothetical protein
MLVGAVMLVLLIVGGVVYRRLREEMTILPDPPNTSGAANPDDFKDWKRRVDSRDSPSNVVGFESWKKKK